MRVTRIAAFLFGVTLSVAPIFSSAWAQQSNQQANLLMEMQALRSEIAELRDMVERQQYQIRQMQRVAPAGTTQPTPGSVTNNYPQAGGQLQVPAADTPAGLPTNDSAIAVDPGARPANAADNTGIPTGEEYATPAWVDENPDSYLPQQTSQPGEIVRQRTPGDVVIEERVISQPSVAPSVSDFPPVEERTIGQSAYPSADQPAENTVNQIGRNDGSNGVIEGANNGAMAPVSSANSTGVIAVPGAVAGAGNQQAPNLQTRPSTPANSSDDGTLNPATRLPQQSTVAAEPLGSPAGIPAVLSEQDYYQQGFELLKQSKHTQAVEVFKQQISSYPQGALADDAHYWIAESMYVNRALDGSKRYFKAIIDNFQQSPRLPDAMLKTAYIEQEQG
ncbi:MAG: hypothetical protein HKN85_11240, partial [Gammaproteobacteria bacterium]|nr:hypothetical protein [Gammaproteobacteria bacterium]